MGSFLSSKKWGRVLCICDSFFSSRPGIVIAGMLARAGIARYQYLLARAYFDGKGAIEQNSNLAFYWCGRAASRSYPKAESLMGVLHLHLFRYEGAQNAFRWFQRAANHGDVNGLHSLAWCYQQGVGVPKDCSKAFSLWLKAAELGSANSQYAVAKYFHDGDVVKRDLPKAKKWCEQAIRNGAGTEAIELLKLIDQSIQRVG
jgi:uncharacterized protein